jgi:2-C-methyl-D-erythritol 4-phosphate cytidylyltransferase
MSEPPRIAVIITAAGASRRMGGIKKEYRPLPGRFDSAGAPLTVLGASFRAFADIPGVETVVITYPAAPAGDGEASRTEAEAQARRALPPEAARLEGASLAETVPPPEGTLPPGSGSPSRPALLLVPGGATRRASVHRALDALEAYNPRLVLIHDGARPWVDRELIARVIAAALEHGAAIPLLPLSETPKEYGAAGFITRHLKRERVGAAQTPQGFLWPDIRNAHREAEKREREAGGEYTDDAEVWGEFIGNVAVVPGSPQNRKITFPEDLL